MIKINTDFGILIITASGFFKTAKLAEKSMFISIDDFISISSPYIVNLLFSCELYIKALLKHENKSYKKEHNLNNLYSKLSDATKKEINDSYNTKCKNNISLEKFISDNAKAFVDFRYPNEKLNKVPMDLKSLNAIANALNDIAISLYNKETEDNNNAD